MDKNTVIGFVLILGILIGYNYWGSKQTKNYEAEKTNIQEQTQQATQPKQEGTEVSFATIEAMGKSLSNQLIGDEQFYTVDNGKLKLKFSNKGARIWSASLKEYKSYSDYKENKDVPLELFSGDKSSFDLTFFTNNLDLKTSLFYFEPVNLQSDYTSVKDSLAIPFRLYADSTSYLEFVYTVYENDYRVGFHANFVNMDKHIDPRVTFIDVNWAMNASQQEKGHTNENNYTNLVYKFPGKESLEDISPSKDKSETSVEQKLEWMNFKQHFFSTVLNTNGSINNKLSHTSYEEGNSDKLLKSFKATAQMPYHSALKSIPLDFYFLPNHFKTLKSYDKSFEKIIPLGGWIIGMINRGIVIPVFNFLRDYVGSFGVIILILTLIIRLIITPLTWKSYVSSAKMKVLKPKVDAINARYPDQKDAMKKQQEVMALYKRTGVNMFGGCLPMLLQLPILYAMFRFFPSSIELRQESFLWADDLSAFDSFITLPFNIPFYGGHVSLFTILMAVSIFISTKVNMAQQGGMANEQMKQMNAMMLYVMPVFMLVFFNKFSSGLTYYYFLSNIIGFLQTLMIKKYFVNEEELLRKMNEKSKQPVKKSKFQERLDKMVKEQQQIQSKKK